MAKKRKRPPSATELERQIAAEPDDPAVVAAELGLGEDALALQLDAGLGSRLWAGTTFEDRMFHNAGVLARDLVSEVERSLLQQESFDDFRGRLYKALGVEDVDEPLGALAKWSRALDHETRLAWNQAMVAANAQIDTVPVWQTVLDDGTTPECWDRHGRRIDTELGGDTPPLSSDDPGEHGEQGWGCRCSVLTVPNPDSEDEQWAQMGRDQLAEMVDEREQGGGSRREAARMPPSRFAVFREMGGDASGARDAETAARAPTLRAVTGGDASVSTRPSRFREFRGGFGEV